MTAQPQSNRDADPRWARSDLYHNSFLLRPDEALDHALAASAADGLPQIAVSAAQGKLLYLLAKSSTYARALSLQFRDHSLRKTYLAVVRGGRKTFPDVGRGSINAPLRVAGERVVVDEKDVNPTLTDWELLGSSVSLPLRLLSQS